MIIETVVGGLIDLVKGILGSVLPTTPAPLSSIGPLIHGYTWLNGFLPLQEVLDTFRLMVSVAVGLLGIYVVIYALRAVPFLGLGGHD